MCQAWFSCRFGNVQKVYVFYGQEFVVVCGLSCAVERFAVM